VEASSRAMLATARPSCWVLLWPWICNCDFQGPGVL